MARYAPLLDPWLTDVSCAALDESNLTARNVSIELVQLQGLKIELFNGKLTSIMFYYDWFWFKQFRITVI